MRTDMENGPSLVAYTREEQRRTGRTEWWLAMALIVELMLLVVQEALR